MHVFTTIDLQQTDVAEKRDKEFARFIVRPKLISPCALDSNLHSSLELDVI